jgi:hypothetical protein
MTNYPFVLILKDNNFRRKEIEIAPEKGMFWSRRYIRKESFFVGIYISKVKTNQKGI